MGLLLDYTNKIFRREWMQLDIHRVVPVRGNMMETEIGDWTM